MIGSVGPEPPPHAPFCSRPWPEPAWPRARAKGRLEDDIGDYTYSTYPRGGDGLRGMQVSPPFALEK
jgi:hypothetical protein